MTWTTIIEPAFQSDLKALESAWLSSQSVALAHAKRAGDPLWLERMLRCLPPELTRDHFAIATSGSTGEPKLVIGSKARVASLVAAIDVAQTLGDVAETIALLPLSYSYAFVNQWVWAQRFSRRFALVAGGFANPSAVVERLKQAQDAMLCLVGAQVGMLKRYVTEPLPGISRINFAGGPFPSDACAWLRETFPAATLYNNFGCTEAMPRLTVCKVDRPLAPGEIGPPLPGISLRVGDGERVEFRSPFCAIGVASGDRFTAFDEAWIPTGDLGEVVDGAVRLQGRAAEVFKRFGEKISLPDQAATIKEHWPGDLAFYRMIDPAGEPGHVLALAPIPSPDALKVILLAYRKRFSRAHWPLRIEALPSLPRLPSGKFDIVRLAEQAETHILWEQRIAT